jgi:hypothetical protein
MEVAIPLSLSLSLPSEIDLFVSFPLRWEERRSTTNSLKEEK